jgi:hypothetical protein
MTSHVYRKFEDGSRFLFLHSSDPDFGVMDIFLCDIATVPRGWSENGSQVTNEQFLAAIGDAFSDSRFSRGFEDVEREGIIRQELDGSEWGFAEILPSHAARADAAVETLP